VFLLVVDSMRRDYVSPYNPAVTFTPEIGKLAADSFVFQRAFTRYSGTGMSVPSIWAGGMIIHVVQQSAFARRNTLMKLVDANDYAQMMTVDNIVEDFIARDAKLQRLGERMGKTEFDACRTLAELERSLEARGTARIARVLLCTSTERAHRHVGAAEDAGGREVSRLFRQGGRRCPRS
jgi:Arylsulfatase A and related enzymes